MSQCNTTFESIKQSIAHSVLNTIKERIPEMVVRLHCFGLDFGMSRVEGSVMDIYRESGEHCESEITASADVRVQYAFCNAEKASAIIDSWNEKLSDILKGTVDMLKNSVEPWLALKMPIVGDTRVPSHHLSIDVQRACFSELRNIISMMFDVFQSIAKYHEMRDNLVHQMEQQRCISDNIIRCLMRTDVEHALYLYFASIDQRNNLIVLQNALDKNFDILNGPSCSGGTLFEK